MRRALSLYLASQEMQSGAANLHVFKQGLHNSWHDLEIIGAFADAARAQLTNTTEQLELPAKSMEAAAETLRAYAPILARVEQLRAEATRLLARMDEIEPWSSQIGAMLNALDALGDGLDWACAREIDALCTPELPTGGGYLEDYEELPIEAIHQMLMSTAPPEAVALAESNPDVQLLEAGPGRVAALVDPGQLGTSAASISTVVSGVHSSDPSGWQSSVDRARAVARATGGPAVAWIGYRAPDSLAQAGHDSPATRGAQDLRRFQRSLGKRFSRSQRIVVGYSYGSVVAGKAAKAPGVAEDVVFVGSPGTTAESADDIQARSWAATNAHDPIGVVTGPRGGIHGPDPSTPNFGASPLPGANRLPGDHISYFKDPAFLRGLGKIVEAKS